MKDLFGVVDTPARSPEHKPSGWYQTPSWACEELIARYYWDLTSRDNVVEPSCGEGHFLDAIPSHIPAIGIELDPVRAAIARERTGREVLVGDVLEIELSRTPTLVIGNPPFKSELIDGLLDRVYKWLPEGGRCGLILPAFILSKQTRVMREADRWSIEAEIVPRDLFPGPRLPIVFARFRKEEKRSLVGFSLFAEAAMIRSLPHRIRQMLSHGRSPAWKEVVFNAIRDQGGEASLEQLYRAIEGRRPTANPHWKAKVRQVVHCYAERVGPSTWKLPEVTC